MNNNTNSDRIWFVQALRGYAVIGVVIYHVIFKFWYNHNLLMLAFPFLPALTHERYLLYFPLLNIMEKLSFDLGAFSVSVFFLISGFIIPFSINKFGLKRFLISRFFRIYPPYFVGASISFIMISLYVIYSNQSAIYGIKNLLIQTSLFRSFFGIPSIDGISWTLEIEILFYITIALLYRFNLMNNAKVIAIGSICLTILSIIYTNYLPAILNRSLILYNISFTLNFSLIFITFMFIGLSFYQFYIKKWNLMNLLIMIQILFINFFVLLNSGVLGINDGMIYLVSFTCGLIIFINIYYFRDKLKPNKVINFFADISYSLYIVHATNSYIIMTILDKSGIHPYISIPLTIGIAVLTAILLNKFIEIPSNKFGKRISNMKTKYLL